MPQNVQTTLDISMFGIKPSTKQARDSDWMSALNQCSMPPIDNNYKSKKKRSTQKRLITSSVDIN